MIAGGIAGIVNAPIVCSAELVKCKLQMQKEGPKVYKNSLDCGIKLFRQNGPRGIFQGNVATIWREIPAYAAQFYMYETCQGWIRDKNRELYGGKGDTSM